jgi:hypothetical protein
MAKMSLVTVEEAAVVPAPDGTTGDVETRTLLTGADEPIHLDIHRLAPHAAMTFAGAPGDGLVYVWEGGVQAAGAKLVAGSSAIVEFGARLKVEAGDAGARLVVFRMRERTPDDRAGGHVHLMPKDRVLRKDDEASGIGTALHADADCPTCRVWLHEVAYPGTGEEKLHSHSADEIIFVIGGTVRLGRRTFGPGAALAIEGGTNYRFHYGPDGLNFINFRGAPSHYAAADGSWEMDETPFWQDFMGRPQYLVPA